MEQVTRKHGDSFFCLVAGKGEKKSNGLLSPRFFFLPCSLLNIHLTLISGVPLSDFALFTASPVLRVVGAAWAGSGKNSRVLLVRAGDVCRCSRIHLFRTKGCCTSFFCSVCGRGLRHKDTEGPRFLCGCFRSRRLLVVSCGSSAWRHIWKLWHSACKETWRRVLSKVLDVNCVSWVFCCQWQHIGSMHPPLSQQLGDMHAESRISGWWRQITDTLSEGLYKRPVIFLPQVKSIQTHERLFSKGVPFFLLFSPYMSAFGGISMRVFSRGHNPNPRAHIP